MPDNNELLVRIDERTHRTQDDVAEIKADIKEFGCALTRERTVPRMTWPRSRPTSKSSANAWAS